MRYLGNKTKLLPFIRGTLRSLALPPGTAHDAFAGTAAVGRALKRAGWRVASSDTMYYSYVFQRAYVVAAQVHAAAVLAALRAGDPDVDRALRSPALRRRALGRGGALALVGEYLAGWVDPECGFVTTHYAPEGGRMFFTSENARRIDGARHALHRWNVAGLVDDDIFHLLLAALLEGADRVANTAGTYSAYIKEWQPNARRRLTIEPVPPVTGPAGAVALRADAAAAARALGPVDLLYVDPPYNTRQYERYYAVPEVIARGWFDAPIPLRGKTGLLAEKTKSPWCSKRRAPAALRELLAATAARHVLVSYNSEGLLPGEVIVDALAGAAVDGRVRRRARAYRRYRADSDRLGRRYKGDSVREVLYYARLR